jgi:tetratricopeptide (TPR) repeat protein
MSWHLTADLARRFLEQRVSPAERRALVRHLLTQCAACLDLMSRVTAESSYWRGKREPVGQGSHDYETTFESLFKFANNNARRAADQRLLGEGQWSVLAPLPPPKRLVAIVEHSRYQHWGLFQAILDAARSHAFRDPLQAVDIAQLALDVVDLLDPAAVGGPEVAYDRRALAHALLANSRRLAADFTGARSALAAAWACNEKGTGDPLEKAHLYSFDASYRRQIGELEAAEILLDKALTLYQSAGETHLQGRTCIKLGTTVGYLDPARGIAHLQRGLSLINPVREPRLELCAQHDLAWFLTDAHRPFEALAILQKARTLYQQFPDDWTQLRLQWIQGRIARGLHHHAEAISILQQVRQSFSGRDLHFDYLMASLDLAETHTAAGDPGAATDLLTATLPILEAWHLHRHTLAALISLQSLLTHQTKDSARHALFARLRLYFHRYWHTPTAATFE